MLPKNEFAGLIPHAGEMNLLDAVVAYDTDTIHARSDSHGLDNHPLRDANGLHAVNLAEYGAQAMAVHGGLKREPGAAVKPGRLVSLRDIRLEVEYVDPAAGALDVHAHCIAADDGGAQYGFRIEQAGQLLASGRAVVIHPR